MTIDEIDHKLSLLCEKCFGQAVDTDMLKYIDFIDDAAMDSVAFISLIIEIESTFEIVIPDHLISMPLFRNYDSCVEVIQKVLNGCES